jgi:hypothetical protein
MYMRKRERSKVHPQARRSNCHRQHKSFVNVPGALPLNYMLLDVVVVLVCQNGGTGK